MISGRFLVVLFIHSYYIEHQSNILSRGIKRYQKLQKLQRQMDIRVTSSYRTISTEAVGLIGGFPPIDLQVTERTEKYNRTPMSIARENLIA